MNRGRFCVGIGVLLVAWACQARGPAETRIALVLKTPNNPFFIDMQQGAEAAARRLGVRLVVQSPEREIDVEKQMQIVENLVETGIAALCIAPASSKGILPALAKANAARHPDRGRRRRGGCGRGGGGRCPHRELRRLGQRGGGPARGPSPGRGERGPREGRGARGHTRATRPATRGCAGFTRRSRPPPVSRWCPPRPRTGSATRASASSRTCSRRTPRSTRSSPATT